MAAVQITCADCGADHTAGRKDAKYCPPCRLLRVITYAHRKIRWKLKCKTCSEKFKPAHQRDYTICGHCEPANHKAEDITCVICKQPGKAWEKVAVCAPCVKDPTNQPKVLKALRRGRDLRKAQNHRPKETP